MIINDHQMIINFIMERVAVLNIPKIQLPSVQSTLWQKFWSISKVNLPMNYTTGMFQGFAQIGAFKNLGTVPFGGQLTSYTLVAYIHN